MPRSNQDTMPGKNRGIRAGQYSRIFLGPLYKKFQAHNRIKMEAFKDLIGFPDTANFYGGCGSGYEVLCKPTQKTTLKPTAKPPSSHG